MNLTHEERLSRIHLIEELDLSVSVIKHGLAILQRSSAAQTRYFLFMLTLSTGIERLMKVLLCLHSLDSQGSFRSEQELKSFRHNLVRLKDEVVDKCFNAESLRRPAVREDLDFIQNDALMNEVLETLSDFAMRDRYIYMDGINDPNADREWLDTRWDRVERMTMPEDASLSMVAEGRLDEYISYANRCIVICLERFLRALARTVTLSGLSADASSLGTGVWDFLMKHDEDLGQTEYKI